MSLVNVTGSSRIIFLEVLLFLCKYGREVPPKPLQTKTVRHWPRLPGTNLKKGRPMSMSASVQLSPMSLARQSVRFGKPPPSTTVEAIEKLTERRVARLKSELTGNSEVLVERDQFATTALERLTRKVGILSLLPATQRMDLCRRMNLLKIRDEAEPLFRQGDYSIDYYIPLLGAFECVSEHHEQRDIDALTGSFYPPTEVRRIVGAGKDMYFEQGVGMPWEGGAAHKEGATARCTSTAWPLLREPKDERGKNSSGRVAKKMTISERRAAKRPGGLCIVLAVPMQDLIDVLKVQEKELETLARIIGNAFEPFRSWRDNDLFALAFQFERQVFEAGESIVKEHASNNGRFYLVTKGKVDLVWTLQEHHKCLRCQMVCGENSACFGEHLLCGEAYEAVGGVPQYVAAASENGPCEIFVGNASAIAPYLGARDLNFVRDLFEMRQSFWFQTHSTSMSKVARRPPSRMKSPESWGLGYSSMESPGEEQRQEAIDRFERFAPRGTKSSSPSKLKYTEKLLTQGDEDPVEGSPRHSAALSPHLRSAPRLSKVLPSTRILVRPQSIDLAEENWSMNLSSPYKGRMTFTAPPGVLQELSRLRMTKTVEKLPTLLDGSHILQVLPCV